MPHDHNYTRPIQANSTLEAELQALCQEVAICISNGVSKVVLKGDSLILVDNFHKELILSCDVIMVTWKKLLLLEVQSWETNKAV